MECGGNQQEGGAGVWKLMDKQYFRLTSRDTGELFRLIKKQKEQETRHLGSFDLVVWL